MICWVKSCQVQGESESIEILFNVCDVWIPVVERSVCSKLLLNKDLEPWPDPGRDDLGAFGVEIAAKPLEVGGEQKDEAAGVLVSKLGIRRREAVRSQALSFDLAETWSSVVQPKG